MVLGKVPVPGRPTIWITVGQGPTALAVGAGWGCLDILTLLYPFFPLSPSLWETARYRLKYCLKGPLNPKPTNQLKMSLLKLTFCFVAQYENVTKTHKGDYMSVPHNRLILQVIFVNDDDDDLMFNDASTHRVICV